MYSPEILLKNLYQYLQELEDLLKTETQPNILENITKEKSNIEDYVAQLKLLPKSYLLTAEHIRAGINLVDHPEGGYYREFIRTNHYTTIFYLIPKEAVSAWHSLRNTKEKFKLISGDSLCIPKISSNGNWLTEEEVSYENNVIIEKNEKGNFGHWFGAYLKSGKYTLVTCECKGPFDFTNFKLASKEDLNQFCIKNPEHIEIINKLDPNRNYNFSETPVEEEDKKTSMQNLARSASFYREKEESIEKNPITKSKSNHTLF